MSPRGALVDTRPLRDQPVFRRLWLGTTASAFGSQVGLFAVTYYVWNSTHNPAMVGLIGLFSAAPLIGFALLGSAFVDHVDRRRIAFVTTTGELATSVLMAIVATSSSDDVWTMLILAGVASGLSALNAPVRRTFIPLLLPDDRLAAGLALNHLSFQLAMLLGPIVAGVLVGLWGTAVCFGVDALTCTASLAGIAGLPAIRPTTDSDPARRGGVLPESAEAFSGSAGAIAVWDGIRFVARTPAARGALLADLSATVLAMPMALFPVINEEKFGGAPMVLGLLASSVAVGGVVASALSGLVTRSDHLGRTLLACGAVWGASLVAVGLSSELSVVVALLAIAGAADTWAVVSRGTVVQSSSPEIFRGRVASLEHIVGVAGPQIGGLRAGFIAAGTSGGTSLVIGGATCLAAIGLIAATSPQLRHFSLRPRVTLR